MGYLDCDGKEGRPPEKRVQYYAQADFLARPPLKSDIRSGSPQQWKVDATNTIWIPVIVTLKNQGFVIQKFNWQTYSRQAEQDLRVIFQMGKKSYPFYSGKINSAETSPPFKDPDSANETRADSQTGGKPNTISRVGGAGFHDNFSRKYDDFFAIIGPDQFAGWKVWNQSQLFTHSIEVSYYGWTFNIHGRDWESIVSGGI